MSQLSLHRPAELKSLRNVAATLALAAAGSVAGAAVLPSFTFNPGGVGLNGDAFSANNLLISDYSTVTSTGSSFTDVGFLSISAAQTSAGTFTPDGLNSDYGLYIAFSGTGTSSPGDPTTDVTTGVFTSMSFTLYGYNGTATFGFSGDTPTTTAVNPIALATGTLISGKALTYPNGDGSFTPTGSAKLHFVVQQPGFFASPTSFYDIASTAFANTSSQVEPLDNGFGFRIRQGGGSVNFASAVPEPGSYALIIAGLGVIGFVARRKSGRAHR